jgi:hypothetical protein
MIMMLLYQQNCVLLLLLLFYQQTNDSLTIFHMCVKCVMGMNSSVVSENVLFIFCVVFAPIPIEIDRKNRFSGFISYVTADGEFVSLIKFHLEVREKF